MNTSQRVPTMTRRRTAAFSSPERKDMTMARDVDKGSAAMRGSVRARRRSVASKLPPARLVEHEIRELSRHTRTLLDLLRACQTAEKEGLAQSK